MTVITIFGIEWYQLLNIGCWDGFCEVESVQMQAKNVVVAGVDCIYTLWDSLCSIRAIPSLATK